MGFGSRLRQDGRCYQVIVPFDKEVDLSSAEFANHTEEALRGLLLKGDYTGFMRSLKASGKSIDSIRTDPLYRTGAIACVKIALAGCNDLIAKAIIGGFKISKTELQNADCQRVAQRAARLKLGEGKFMCAYRTLQLVGATDKMYASDTSMRAAVRGFSIALLKPASWLGAGETSVKSFRTNSSLEYLADSIKSTRMPPSVYMSATVLRRLQTIMVRKFRASLGPNIGNVLCDLKLAIRVFGKDKVLTPPVVNAVNYMNVALKRRGFKEAAGELNSLCGEVLLPCDIRSTPPKKGLRHPIPRARLAQRRSIKQHQ